jgi:hypothetical protein
MTSTMRFDRWENSLGQPYGAVLQVVQTVDAQVRTISNATNDTFNPYTALSTTVTPRVSNSRFLIRFQANIGGGPTGGGSFRAIVYVNGNAVGTAGTGNQRASSNSIYLNAGLPGDASIHGLTGEFLFQNSGTSNVAITMDIYKQNGAQPLYINRSFSYDDASRGRPASWITIQEIA